MSHYTLKAPHAQSTISLDAQDSIRRAVCAYEETNFFGMVNDLELPWMTSDKMLGESVRES